MLCGCDVKADTTRYTLCVDADGRYNCIFQREHVANLNGLELSIVYEVLYISALLAKITEASQAMKRHTGAAAAAA